MTLHPYQVEGVKRLVSGSLLLLDDVGLGKGVQSAAALRVLQPRRVLVVCPLSMVNTWMAELATWAPDLYFQKHGTDWKCYKFVTNYEHLEPYLNRSWDAVVFDEAHRVKNRKAIRSANARTLARHSTLVWCLTANPMMNRADEIWHLLNLVDRKTFRSYWKFAQEWCQLGVSTWSTSGIKIEPGVRAGGELAFAKMLDPFVLRRTKAEVGQQLPSLTKQVHWLDMTPSQAAIHKQIMKQLKVEIDGGDPLTIRNVLTRLTYARRCAVSPFLVGATGPSAKMIALADLIFSNSRRNIIFSQWTGALDEAECSTDHERPRFAYTGDLTEARRQYQLDQWRAHGDGNLFATIGAGGVGLTLTDASNCIVMDEPWNPYELEQAIGRLHRIGQTEPVTAHILRCRDSIEEYVADTGFRKQEMVEKINQALAAI